MVRFSVTRTGEITAVQIFTSSGVNDLDDEAVATIWRARPMPTIPVVLPDHLSVTLPVTFKAKAAG
jgi:protein TonB